MESFAKCATADQAAQTVARRISEIYYELVYQSRARGGRHGSRRYAGMLPIPRTVCRIEAAGALGDCVILKPVEADAVAVLDHQLEQIVGLHARKPDFRLNGGDDVVQIILVAAESYPISNHFQL